MEVSEVPPPSESASVEKDEELENTQVDRPISRGRDMEGDRVRNRCDRPRSRERTQEGTREYNRERDMEDDRVRNRCDRPRSRERMQEGTREWNKERPQQRHFYDEFLHWPDDDPEDSSDEEPTDGRRRGKRTSKMHMVMASHKAEPPILKSVDAQDIQDWATSYRVSRRYGNQLHPRDAVEDHILVLLEGIWNNRARRFNFIDADKAYNRLPIDEWLDRLIMVMRGNEGCLGVEGTRVPHIQMQLDGRKVDQWERRHS